MSVGERCMADKRLAYFKSYATKKDIIIFDRGYPSHELIASLENSGISYLMRILKRFIPVLDSSLEHDIMHVIYFEKQYYSVRAIKVQLPTGEIERLITNLPHEDFSHNDFLALYFLRWPIESKYNTIKNKLFLETFSGKTAIAIKQDFYATMYLANLTAFAKYESDSLIKEKTVGKFSKYTYKANENVLIGLLKTNFITIFYSKSQYIKKKKIRLLIEQSSTFIIAERPGRHYDRPQKKNKWINNCVNKAKTAL